MNRICRSVVCLSSVLFFSASLLFADYNKYGVPDSSELRRPLIESWFTSPLEYVRMNTTEIRKNSIGQQFQVRMEEQGNSFIIIVAPQMNLGVDVYTEKGVEHQVASMYPVDASGSWILSRDSISGKPLLIRYYFEQDSDVYVQFAPDGQKTLADYVICGNYAARSVPVGVPFERFYTASFEDVIDLTKNTLPWKYAEIHGDQYHASLQMASVIRKNLGRITYADDAAYNEDGKPIKISDGGERNIAPTEKEENLLSLSSAGFVKWIMDGLVEPRTGSGTLIAPLSRRTVEYKPQGYSGIRSETDDISFTLDWTRNLASAWLSVRTGKTYYYDDSGVDVKIQPFSAESTENGIVQTAGYIENTGYASAKLRPIMYVLAVTEPTYFYLAAVRRSDSTFNISSSGVSKKQPEMFVFDQTAVLFPYFDASGRFGCIVFENGQEMPLNTFTAKYKNCFVHLTRVLASDNFFPR